MTCKIVVMLKGLTLASLPWANCLSWGSTVQRGGTVAKKKDDVNTRGKSAQQQMNKQRGIHYLLVFKEFRIMFIIQYAERKCT
jgi:hypothetical protein